jgi:tRNA threonylcarbamoyladenosine biosynthesis protein TsaB
MKILAVDTAAEIGSIALADENGVTEEARLAAGSGFGQTLFGELAALLGRHGLGVADIDLFAAASGPGSFTGVRVGLAAVKGMAEVAGKPAAGISNLTALASYGSAALRAPIIDARRGEIFGALCDAAGTAVEPACVMPFAAFVTLVGDRAVEYISAGFDPGFPVAKFPVTQAPVLLAGRIAVLARERFRSGAACDPAAMEADYVRRPDAELFGKT